MAIRLCLALWFGTLDLPLATRCCLSDLESHESSSSDSACDLTTPESGSAGLSRELRFEPSDKEAGPD